MIKLEHKTNSLARVQLKNISEQILKKIALAVGWFEETKYSDNISVASVAKQNEFGNAGKRIPPRPFMRPLMAKEKDNWIRLISQELRKEIENGGKIENALGRIGMVIQGQIQGQISKVHSPKLSQFTIEKRISNLSNGKRVAIDGIDKPLIDTGLMINSVQHKIIEGGLKKDTDISSVNTRPQVSDAKEMLNKALLKNNFGV